MGHIITDLKETFRRGNIFIQLIYINVSIFYHWHVNQCFLATISAQYTRYIRHIRFTGFLYSVLSSTMVDYHLYVHARRSSAYPIQYALVVLVRKLVSTLFSAKHLRGLYILGGILGGLLYMVAYNVFPLFNQEVAVSTLVGASASVLAIVAATAYREPNYRVQLFLFGAIRLKYLALVVIGIDVLSITSSNGRRTYRSLGRRSCRTLVCRQPKQRGGSDRMDQLASGRFYLSIPEKDMETQTQNESTLRRRHDQS